MATLKRRVSPVAPDVTPIPLWSLIGHTARRPDDPRRDRVWLDLRAEIGALLMCTEFDPRKDLHSGDAAQQAARHEARLLMLARHFATDPRVTTEDGGR
jgi:hypothetical protein